MEPGGPPLRYRTRLTVQVCERRLPGATILEICNEGNRTGMFVVVHDMPEAELGQTFDVVLEA